MATSYLVAVVQLPRVSVMLGCCADPPARQSHLQRAGSAALKREKVVT
jgi:hypothetical protein